MHGPSEHLRRVSAGHQQGDLVPNNREPGVASRSKASIWSRRRPGEFAGGAVACTNELACEDPVTVDRNRTGTLVGMIVVGVEEGENLSGISPRNDGELGLEGKRDRARRVVMVAGHPDYGEHRRKTEPRHRQVDGIAVCGTGANYIQSHPRIPSEAAMLSSVRLVRS